MQGRQNEPVPSPGWKSEAVLGYGPNRVEGNAMSAQQRDESVVAKRDPGIVDAIGRLSRAIAEADDKLDSLFARLDPVLSIPDPECKAIEKDLPGSSALCRELVGMATRVEALSSGMHNIYYRIEL